MTTNDLQYSFDYFVNSSIVPQYDIDFYNSFNYNTNTTLKTDFMTIIFITLNYQSVPDFITYMYPYVFLFTIDIIIPLLDWCFLYNYANYFKYVINNAINCTNKDIYEILNAGFLRNPFEQKRHMFQLVDYIMILKKYNYSNKLEYYY